VDVFGDLDIDGMHCGIHAFNSGFGTKTPLVDAEWIRVNGLTEGNNSYNNPEGVQVTNGIWIW